MYMAHVDPPKLNLVIGVQWYHLLMLYVHLRLQGKIRMLRDNVDS